jgi:hypothetical protein
MPTVLVKSSPFYLSHMLTFSLLGLPLLAGEAGVVPIMAMLIPVWVSSSVLFSELRESYGFLRTLPLTDREVVGAKFLLALGAVAVYWVAMIWITVQTGIGTPLFPRNLALVHLSVIFSLLAAACWYIGIWLFGTTVMTIVVVTFMVVGTIGSIVLRFGPAGSPAAWAMIHELVLVRLLAASPWFVYVLLAVVALLAYYALMRLAVRVKRTSEAHI